MGNKEDPVMTIQKSI